MAFFLLTLFYSIFISLYQFYLLHWLSQLSGLLKETWITQNDFRIKFNIWYDLVCNIYDLCCKMNNTCISWDKTSPLYFWYSFQKILKTLTLILNTTDSLFGLFLPQCKWICSFLCTVDARQMQSTNTKYQ